MATTGFGVGAIGMASGTVALLQEKEVALKRHALQSMYTMIDEHWAELVDSVADIEEIAEDGPSELKELASAVASKCYFHLEDFDQAVVLALGAGSYFDVSADSEYVNTVVARCIDNYATQRVANATTSSQVEIDPRLEAVVERMFERCFRDGELRQVVGISLESRRIDMLRRAIDAAGSDRDALLRHCIDLAHRVVKRKEFRTQVLEALVDVYSTSESPDYVGLSRCMEFLNKPAEMASMLNRLIASGDESDRLVALQLAFDIYEHDDQHFLVAVMKALPVKDGDGASAADEAAAAPADATDDFWSDISTIREILDGSLPAKIHLDFLARKNRADRRLLEKIKAAADAQGRSIMEAKSNSVRHNAVVMTHAIMHAGTTLDGFLRDNLEWLGKANNWARFSAVASIGVIHRGHSSEAMTVLAPYLPNPARASVSAFTEGGSLYALGLINANKGQATGGEVISFLSEALRNTQQAPIQHGGALGIGLAAMATGNDSLYAQLRDIMFQDDADAGEAAALGIGLILCGRGSSWSSDITGEAAVSEMLNYARDTAHEKIIRGIAMSLALIVFQQEEAADVLIAQMLRDKDPLLRYGAAYAMAMAYCATSNNAIIRKLLHIAVSDVSDDVRRAAVTALGFVMADDPGQVPRIVSLMTESFNPHVRYGAAVAIGISCAATGMKEAVELLEPLSTDQVDFVRQGALIALGMVLQQEAEGRNPKVKAVRDQFIAVVEDRVKPTLTKTGAILGAGLIDAGGRNSAISIRSASGYTKMSSVVGMAIFWQHWYWSPYIAFIGLSLHPTALIGLNRNLKMPQGFSAVCAAKPSRYAYPQPLVEAKDDSKDKIVKMELSTVKRKRRGLQRSASTQSLRSGGTPRGTPRAGAEGGRMEEDAADAPKPEAAAADAVPPPTEAAAEGTAAAAAEKGAETDKPAQPEPTSFLLENPSRVTLSQRQAVRLNSSDTARYVPIIEDVSLLSSVLILRDLRPDEDEEIVEFKQPGDFGEDAEAPPPEPFEWTPPE